jgi:foldase protein PrsA
MLCISLGACVSGYMYTQESTYNKPIVPVDRIKATVYHPQATVIIAESDLRPGLDGLPRTLDDVIFDNLIRIDAQKIGIDDISEDEVDRLLSAIQKQNNLTKEGLIEAFKQSGFTEELGRLELKNKEIRDRMIRYRIKDEMTVSEDDIKKYYDEHPEYQPGSLSLRQAVVPFSAEEQEDESLKDKKRNAVKRDMQSRDILFTVEWDNPFTIQEEDVEPDNAFIKDLKKDGISVFKETGNGIVLVHVVDKKKPSRVPLEDVKTKISSQLHEQRYHKALESYKDKLLSSAHIAYHDENHTKDTKDK